MRAVSIVATVTIAAAVVAALASVRDERVADTRSASPTDSSVGPHAHRDANKAGRVQRCPALDPLPPGARSRSRDAALRAVDRLYPDVDSATVTAVGPPPYGTPCGRRVTARTLEVDLHVLPHNPAARRSASLSQGRLFVGSVGGRMAVWSVMH